MKKVLHGVLVLLVFTAITASRGASPLVAVFATEPGWEGAPSHNGIFTFTRTGPTTGTLTVSFSTGGSALSGTDYTPLNNTVVFGVGQSAVTLNVIVFNDSTVE